MVEKGAGRGTDRPLKIIVRKIIIVKITEKVVGNKIIVETARVAAT